MNVNISANTKTNANKYANISANKKKQISMQISVQIHMQPRTNTTGTSALQHLHCAGGKLKLQNIKIIDWL